VTFLRRAVKDNKLFGQAKTAAQLAASIPGKTVSKSTIIRELHSWPDIKRVKPRKSLYLTSEQIANRYLASQTLKDLPKAFWKTVTFMDEKKFSASGPDSVQRIWSLAGHEPLRATHTSSRLGVMVWMAIGPHGLLGPFRINGSLTGVSYARLLKRYAYQLSLRAYDDWATCHSTNEVLRFFENQGIEHIRFSQLIPAKLVELNIQEQVWSYIVRLVYEGNPCFRNAGELWSRIVLVCNQVRATGKDKEWFDSLAATIPERMRSICKKKGTQLNLSHL
jgi:hypothetical protein